MRTGIVRSSAIVVLLVGLGCTSTHQVDVAELDSRLDSGLSRESGHRLKGYTTIDGKYHKTEDGRARFRGADTLEIAADGEPSFGQPGFDKRGRSWRSIPRDSIASLDLVYSSTVKNAVGIASLAVVAAGVIVLAESCPYLYSWNRQEYVLDGEPYGGATMRSLERTDWSELEEMVEDGGRYRVLLTNELAETQHTNSLQLLTVDHAPGSTVVLDRHGVPHAFRTRIPLSAARDEQGRDLLAWLKEDDRVIWYPNLLHHAGSDSLTDTRNHVTLTFRGRPKSGRAYLVTRAATGPFGSHMIRTMLQMRGNQVGAFYAAINHVPPFRERLVAWNEREELFHLAVEVETRDGWRRQESISGGGPLVAERRAIPLDLSGVSSDEVRIRIHPPIGFWTFNFFELAWDEADLATTVLDAVSARDQDHAEVSRRLRNDDAAYLDAPARGHWAEIEFRVPPARSAATERSVFARTRGWYELHLEARGWPDTRGLDRLTNEPGYAVRKELEGLRALRRIAAAPQAADSRSVTHAAANATIR